MLLSEDHIAVQDAVRSYVQAEIAPHAAEWDKAHRFPAAALKGLASLGCYGVAVPAEWDGAGLDYLALALILNLTLTLVLVLALIPALALTPWSTLKVLSRGRRR